MNFSRWLPLLVLVAPLGCRGDWHAIQPHRRLVKADAVSATPDHSALSRSQALAPRPDTEGAKGNDNRPAATSLANVSACPAEDQQWTTPPVNATPLIAPEADTSADVQEVSSRNQVLVSTALDSTLSSSASTDPTARDTQPQTLAELESRALAQHPALAEQQARIDALRGKWTQAGLRPNPYLGFSGQQLFSQGQAEQIGVLAGQKIVRSEKIAWDQAVVCREIEVAEQLLAARRLRILTDLRIRFYDVLIAQRRTEVSAQLLKIAETSLNKTQSLLTNELGTQVDVLRSDVELQAAKVQAETARNQLKAAWQQLAAAIGEPDLAQQVLHGSLEPDGTALDVSAWRQRILAESPEIAGALSEQQRAQAQLQRALVEPLGDVDVESTVQHDNGIGGTDANLIVSVPIPRRNRNQGGIQEARMQVVATQLAQDRITLELQGRLATAIQAYDTALAQAQGFAAPDGILVKSQRTLELIQKAYDAGEIGSLDLVSAQRVHSQTNLQYLDALAAYWTAKWELEGLLPKDGLND